MIDWDSPAWGKAGHNIHESTNGSWVDAEAEEDQ